MKNILQAIKSCLNGLRVYVDKVVKKATVALATQEDTAKIKGLAETAQATADNVSDSVDSSIIFDLVGQPYLDEIDSTDLEIVHGSYIRLKEAMANTLRMPVVFLRGTFIESDHYYVIHSLSAHSIEVNDDLGEITLKFIMPFETRPGLYLIKLTINEDDEIAYVSSDTL